MTAHPARFEVAIPPSAGGFAPAPRRPVLVHQHQEDTIDDPNSDHLYALLEIGFGPIHEWPRPDDGPAAEAAINRALDVAFRPPIDAA
ncbi:MAG: hypothetical protein ABJF67_19300, partial [Aurantimonas coralicida]